MCCVLVQCAVQCVLCVFFFVYSVVCCVCCCSACILHCVFYISSLFLNSNYFALIKLYKYEFNYWYRKKAYYLDALLFLNFNSNNKFQITVNTDFNFAIFYIYFLLYFIEKHAFQKYHCFSFKFLKLLPGRDF